MSNFHYLSLDIPQDWSSQSASSLLSGINSEVDEYLETTSITSTTPVNFEYVSLNIPQDWSDQSVSDILEMINQQIGVGQETTVQQVKRNFQNISVKTYIQEDIERRLQDHKDRQIIESRFLKK